MARDNYMDDESAPSTAEDPVDESGEKSDETEDQLALVPTHFFKKQPVKPRQQEKIEVVQVYENECSIKCVYSEDEEEEDEEEYAEAPAEPEDEMMG
jgi:hypothetical protein